MRLPVEPYQYFNPLPLYRGRHMWIEAKKAIHRISIHFLYTEEDYFGVIPIIIIAYFNPLTLYRGRLQVARQQGKSVLFQSTSSIQRKTHPGKTTGMIRRFQSTSSIQRKTNSWQVRPITGIFQSTSSIQRKTVTGEIEMQVFVKFQSTSSIQRKTKNSARDFLLSLFQSTSSIQRKTALKPVAATFETFQSTSSIQRKTLKPIYNDIMGIISIHFLYTEEDRSKEWRQWLNNYFNPLPLYRGRHGKKQIKKYVFHFNPLPLYRGRRRRIRRHVLPECISIHFLYTEEDMKHRITLCPIKYFNPLPLYRGRRNAQRYFLNDRSISIHFLYTEEDNIGGTLC